MVTLRVLSNLKNRIISKFTKLPINIHSEAKNFESFQN